MFTSLPLSRRTKRTDRVVFRPSLESLEHRLVPVNFNWVAPCSGDFGVAANWSPPGVPGPGDDATFNRAGCEVSSNVSRTVNSLRVFDGRLRLDAGVFTVNNDFVQSSIIQLTVNAGATLRTAGGTTNLGGGGSILRGTLDVTAGAELQFDSGVHAVNAAGVFPGPGRHVVNGGTLSLVVGLNAPADLEIRAGGIAGMADLTIGAGTTTRWTGGQMTGPGTTVVALTGTLALSSANAKALNTRVLTNNGTINWTGSGNLQLNTDSRVNNAGAFNVETDSDVQNFGLTSTFVNSGTLSKRNSTVTTAIGLPFNNVGGTIDVQTGTLMLNSGTSTGGTYNAAAGGLLDITGGGGAQQNISGTFTGSGAGTVRFSGGTLNILAGGATFDFPGNLFQWTGGTLNAGAVGLTLTNAGTLTLAGGNAKAVNVVRLANPGTVVLAGNGTLQLNTGTTFDNTGTFSVESDADVQNFGLASTFVNSGILRKRNSTVTSAFSSFFNNVGGTIDVQSGTLRLNAGNSTGATITVAADAVLDLGPGVKNISGTFTGTGAGTVLFAGGTLNVLEADATFNFEGTLFQWTGGTLTAQKPGLTLTNDGTITLGGPSAKAINASRLSNNGTVVWGGLGNLQLNTGAVVVNAGIWEVQTDAALQNFSDVSTFDNFGFFYKTIGSEETRIGCLFNNFGGVAVFSGRVRLAMGGSLSGSIDVADGLELTLTGGSHFLEHGLAVTGDGRFVVENATAVVNGAVSAVNFGLESGTFTLTPTGVLNLSGNYSQAAATFRTEINGRDLGAGYGQVNAAGNVFLSGNLQIAFVDGFGPVAGDSFPIFQAGSLNGTFGNVQVFNLDGRLRAPLDYQPTGVTVNIVPAPQPGPGGDDDRTGDFVDALALEEAMLRTVGRLWSAGGLNARRR